MVKFIFFGSSQMSIYVLDELEKAGHIPLAVVTTPDKPVGRKQVMTSTPVKQWAIERNIKVFDPIKLSTIVEELKNEDVQVFLTASYGKIIPKEIFSVPPRHTLNVHPSLLPTYRGASPLQSAVLDDTKDTGVVIMKIDEEMDHGPIIARKEVHIDEWPTYGEFEELMAREGGKLLAQILPEWIAGSITEQEQDHPRATYTRKFSKGDGEINLKDDPYTNFRKIQAFHTSPGSFFFIEKDGERLRIKITAISFKNGMLKIEKVIPEGAKEISWNDFERGYQKNNL